jgi:hypothetical protein
LPRTCSANKTEERIRICGEHVNYDGHDAVRIHGHKGHGGLVGGLTRCVRCQIEPDLGVGTDFCGIAVRPLPLNWKALVLGHHFVVVVRARRPSTFLKTRTCMKVRAEQRACYRGINLRHVDPDRGALAFHGDRDRRLGRAEGWVSRRINQKILRLLSEDCRQRPARGLCSAQNHRASCNAAERNLSNAPHCVPPRVKYMRLRGNSYMSWLCSRANCMATSFRCRPRCLRSRSTRSAPTGGYVLVSRWSFPNGRLPYADSTCWVAEGLGLWR